MPLTDLIRRASSFILGVEKDVTKDMYYDNNEVLFCKNNVCVHPPALTRKDNEVLHHPGYLTITTKVFIDQHNETKRPTLFLTWIPNAAFTKNTSLLASPLSQCNKRSSLESINSIDSNDYIVERPVTIELKNTNPFLNYDDKERSDISDSVSSDDSEKQGISINVDISNPEIEIIQTPDSAKDPKETFVFSR